MEAYLINWLTNKIENYVHVNSHDVNLSLWQGRLSLRNLRLKPTRLDSLKVYLDWGWIESCSVLIDWSYIGTKPIKVEMNGVCLKVKRTRGNTDSPMTSSSDDNTKGLNLSYSFDIHDMKVEVDEMFNISVGHSLLFKSSANVTDGRCHWEIRFRSVSIQDRYNDVSMKLYAEMITCSMISGVSSEVYVANFAATCYHPVTGTETTFISSHNKNGWMFLLTAKFVEGRLSSFRACTQGDIHVRLNGPILNSILTIYQRSTTSIGAITSSPATFADCSINDCDLFLSELSIQLDDRVDNGFGKITLSRCRIEWVSMFGSYHAVSDGMMATLIVYSLEECWFVNLVCPFVSIKMKELSTALPMNESLAVVNLNVIKLDWSCRNAEQCMSFTVNNVDGFSLAGFLLEMQQPTSPDVFLEISTKLKQFVCESVTISAQSLQVACTPKQLLRVMSLYTFLHDYYTVIRNLFSTSRRSDGRSSNKCEWQVDISSSIVRLDIGNGPTDNKFWDIHSPSICVRTNMKEDHHDGNSTRIYQGSIVNLSITEAGVDVLCSIRIEITHDKCEHVTVRFCTDVDLSVTNLSDLLHVLQPIRDFVVWRRNIILIQRRKSGQAIFVQQETGVPWKVEIPRVKVQYKDWCMTSLNIGVILSRGERIFTADSVMFKVQSRNFRFDRIQFKLSSDSHWTLQVRWVESEDQVDKTPTLQLTGDGLRAVTLAEPISLPLCGGTLHLVIDVGEIRRLSAHRCSYLASLGLLVDGKPVLQVHGSKNWLECESVEQAMMVCLEEVRVVVSKKILTAIGCLLHTLKAHQSQSPVVCVKGTNNVTWTMSIPVNVSGYQIEYEGNVEDLLDTQFSCLIARDIDLVEVEGKFSWNCLNERTICFQCSKVQKSNRFRLENIKTELIKSLKLVQCPSRLPLPYKLCLKIKRIVCELRTDESKLDQTMNMHPVIVTDCLCCRAEMENVNVVLKPADSNPLFSLDFSLLGVECYNFEDCRMDTVLISPLNVCFVGDRIEISGSNKSRNIVEVAFHKPALDALRFALDQRATPRSALICYNTTLRNVNGIPPRTAAIVNIQCTSPAPVHPVVYMDRFIVKNMDVGPVWIDLYAAAGEEELLHRDMIAGMGNLVSFDFEVGAVQVNGERILVSQKYSGRFNARWLKYNHDDQSLILLLYPHAVVRSLISTSLFLDECGNRFQMITIPPMGLARCSSASARLFLPCGDTVLEVMGGQEDGRNKVPSLEKLIDIVQMSECDQNLQVATSKWSNIDQVTTHLYTVRPRFVFTNKCSRDVNIRHDRNGKTINIRSGRVHDVPWNSTVDFVLENGEPLIVPASGQWYRSNGGICVYRPGPEKMLELLSPLSIRNHTNVLFTLKLYNSSKENIHTSSLHCGQVFYIDDASIGVINVQYCQTSISAKLAGCFETVAHDLCAFSLDNNNNTPHYGVLMLRGPRQFVLEERPMQRIVDGIFIIQNNVNSLSFVMSYESDKVFTELMAKPGHPAVISAWCSRLSILPEPLRTKTGAINIDTTSHHDIPLKFPTFGHVVWSRCSWTESHIDFSLTSKLLANTATVASFAVKDRFPSFHIPNFKLSGLLSLTGGLQVDFNECTEAILTFRRSELKTSNIQFYSNNSVVDLVIDLSHRIVTILMRPKPKISFTVGAQSVLQSRAKNDDRRQETLNYNSQKSKPWRIKFLGCDQVEVKISVERPINLNIHSAIISIPHFSVDQNKVNFFKLMPLSLILNLIGSTDLMGDMTGAFRKAHESDWSTKLTKSLGHTISTLCSFASNNLLDKNDEGILLGTLGTLGSPSRVVRNYYNQDQPVSSALLGLVFGFGQVITRPIGGAASLVHSLLDSRRDN